MTPTAQHASKRPHGRRQRSKDAGSVVSTGIPAAAKAEQIAATTPCPRFQPTDADDPRRHGASARGDQSARGSDQRARADLAACLTCGAPTAAISGHCRRTHRCRAANARWVYAHTDAGERMRFRQRWRYARMSPAEREQYLLRHRTYDSELRAALKAAGISRSRRKADPIDSRGEGRDDSRRTKRTGRSAVGRGS